ncbi:hypothetical protein QBC35DRAFT_466878 [Podospora australis]|uniref:Uncharacterized protein n=1 Tax=Podospora australis TaxID=1536484 RepID=A0AAN6WPG8_9PEZI|nr:hypothetical protein QBC35DRAFT_466878 [Podospora australis]
MCRMIAAAHQIVLAGLLQYFVAICAAQEQEFFRWDTPKNYLAAHDVSRRQSPPPGYNPQFGSCGTGTTCENACGANWLSCQASTDLSLFCYNKVDLGQTCCENGSGRACDRGFYCAWQTFGGRVWCCEDGQSLEECGVPGGSAITSSTQTSTSSSGTGNPSETSTAITSASTTVTFTDTTTLTGPDPTSTTDRHQCPGSVVTSWATSTVSFTFTVTVTESDSNGGCNSEEPTVSPPPSTSTSSGTTITKPPSSTASKPPTNSTATSTLVTAGSRRLRAVDVLPLALLAMGTLLV